MDLFLPTLNQMIFLFLFIIIGYTLSRLKLVPSGAAGTFAKVENWIFTPALIMQSFMANFTVSTLGSMWKLLLFGFAIDLVVIPITLLLCKFITKDADMRKLCTYGLCFSNCGFMGNAVVSAIFPGMFFEYIVFSITLWIPMYIWAVPSLLIPSDEKKTIASRLKTLINPMFVAMFIGMLIGISGIILPSSVNKVIDVSASCMSPIAMLLTGMTIAEMDVKKTLSKISIYFVSILRLLVYPLVGLAIFALVPANIPDSYVVCAICALAMPLGLNMVVIPAAYGKDVSAASGMALVSHLLSVITIPLTFMLLRILL